jgi:hypothetical protein
VTGDGITHRALVTATAAYPIKQADAGLVRRTCFARVPPGVHHAEPIVRFTDQHGNLYYSYLGYTRRFSQKRRLKRRRQADRPAGAHEPGSSRALTPATGHRRADGHP